VRLVEKLRRII